MEGDPAPARRLIVSVNSAMTGDFMDFSTQAMRDHRLVFGDPAKGEAPGLITRRRMQEQVDLFVGLRVLARPLALEQFVSFDFLPPDLAALSR